MNSLLDSFDSDIKDILDSWSEKQVFIFEITATDKCNCRCSYCFEGHDSRKGPQYSRDDIVDNIEYILKHPHFNEKFKNLRITFWGGEPLLQIDDILFYIEKFGHNKSVSWHFYTNGTLKENLLKVVDAFKSKDALNRVTIQISWDGDPVHDINRFNSSGLAKSSIIKNTYKELYIKGVNVELKATISPKDFKYLPEIWKSYESFILEVTDGNEHHMNWSPTIDQTYDSLEHLSDFKKSLAQICVYEIDYYKKYRKNLLSWFGSDAYSCTYREGMCCVAVNGDVHTCHGIAYDDVVKEYETLGNISNLDWIDKYLVEVGTHELRIPEECSRCSATHCSVCCVQSSRRSDKELPIDRWYDRTTQKNLCKFYQMFGIYDKAVHTILTNETVRGMI